MPVYLTPGVYVEEVPGTPPISPLGTSTAGFIGVVDDSAAGFQMPHQCLVRRLVEAEVGIARQRRHGQHGTGEIVGRDGHGLHREPPSAKIIRNDGAPMKWGQGQAGLYPPPRTLKSGRQRKRGGHDA